MQEFKFNVTGTERKKLAGAISEILNTPIKYLGAPTFAYEVGSYHIDKNGLVTGEHDPNLLWGLPGAALSRNKALQKKPRQWRIPRQRRKFPQMKRRKPPQSRKPPQTQRRKSPGW